MVIPEKRLSLICEARDIRVNVGIAGVGCKRGVTYSERIAPISANPAAEGGYIGVNLAWGINSRRCEVYRGERDFGDDLGYYISAREDGVAPKGIIVTAP